MSSTVSKESQNVFKLVNQAAAVSALFNKSATLKTHTLSLGDVAALEGLKNAAAPVPVKRFAASLGITVRAARGRLRALEKAGLVTLSEVARASGNGEATDKKVKSVAATDKTPAFLGAVAAEMDAAMADGGAAKLEKRLNRIARSARVLGASAGGGRKNSKRGGRAKAAS